MSVVSKKKYTAKQMRKAHHIEESYEEKGVSVKEAKTRAWATVNKQDSGGNKGGEKTHPAANKNKLFPILVAIKL